MSPITLQPSERAITAVASPVKALGVGVLADVVYELFDVFPMPPRGEHRAFARSAVTSPRVKTLSIRIY